MTTGARPRVELTILPPDEVDFGVVADLVNEAYTIYPFMTGPRTHTEMVAEEAGDSGTFLFAHADGALVGCAMIKPSQDVDWSYADGMDPSGPDALYFGLAAVRPGGQRSGVGRALLARAEEMAIAAGYQRMVLTTLAEMGLVNYYEPQGYRSIGTRAFPAFEHWAIEIPHTLHAMEKML